MADQARFEREWSALRGYAAKRGVRLIGDIPIYARQRAPTFGRSRSCSSAASSPACRPTCFSSTGQLWGNPLYHWTSMRAQGFRWWVERVRPTSGLSDLAPLDHFRGFAAYWESRATRKTAMTALAPRAGPDLFDAPRAGLGQLPLVAEDLGVITPAVHPLRDRLGLAGMEVLQFGFGQNDPPARTCPGTASTRRPLVYTGTHDNDTAQGWFDHAPPSWSATPRSPTSAAPRRKTSPGASSRTAYTSVAETTPSSRCRTSWPSAPRRA